MSVLRHGSAGLIVLRIVREHARIGRPHFVVLRRKLDEVAGHVRAGELRVLHIREQAVQRVTELVKRRRDFVEGQQRRLSCRRLRNIQIVDDDGLRAEQARLIDEGVHPCAAALVLARIPVHQEQAQRRAICIRDFEHQHIGLVDRQVLAFFEVHAIQLVRGKQHAIAQHAVHFEIGTHLRFIISVTRAAHLLCIEVPVPRLQLERLACRSPWPAHR